jgi:hypothetical protein
MITKTGPNSKLINLIYKRTKIKKMDIIEVLELLPELMISVFMEENPKQKEPVNFSFGSLSWSTTKAFGATISLKKSLLLSSHLTHHKQNPTTPLAHELSNLRPINPPHTYIKTRTPRGKNKRASSTKPQ